MWQDLNAQDKFRFPWILLSREYGRHLADAGEEVLLLSQVSMLFWNLRSVRVEITEVVSLFWRAWSIFFIMAWKGLFLQLCWNYTDPQQLFAIMGLSLSGRKVAVQVITWVRFGAHRKRFVLQACSGNEVQCTNKMRRESSRTQSTGRRRKSTGEMASYFYNIDWKQRGEKRSIRDIATRWWVSQR